jgi:hypothetical protein
MGDLERRLIEAGRELEFPATPDLASQVARKVPGRPPRRIPMPTRRWRLALVTAALILLLAAAAAAAIPDVRDSLLDLFGLRGATIERTTSLPPAPERPGAGLDLGRRTSLASARTAVPFHVALPADLGAPDLVYLRPHAAGGFVSLAYRARKGLPEASETGLGLLISEFRGRVDPEYIGKLVSFGTRVRRFSIDGQPAVWLAGAPHDFFYRSPSGHLRGRTLRLAANVLLVERKGVLVRLEGSLHRVEAVSIALSLR